MNQWIGWVALALPLFFGACGGSKTTNTNGELVELAEFDANGNENFEAFYVRFSRDSAFQLSRVTFPLKVIPEYTFGTGVPPQLWQREQWVIQKEINSQDTSIRNVIEPYSETWVSEHIYINKMWYMRRDFVFDKTKNQWRLDQYTEMQELARIQNPGMPARVNPVDEPTDSTAGVNISVQ